MGSAGGYVNVRKKAFTSLILGLLKSRKFLCPVKICNGRCLLWYDLLTYGFQWGVIRLYHTRVRSRRCSSSGQGDARASIDVKSKSTDSHAFSFYNHPYSGESARDKRFYKNEEDFSSDSFGLLVRDVCRKRIRPD